MTTITTTTVPEVDPAWDAATPLADVLGHLGLDAGPVDELSPGTEAQEVHALRRAVHRLALAEATSLSRIETLATSLTAEERRLSDFKAQVRAKAREVADEQGWCRGGLNQALRDLGLEPFVTTYRVQATLVARFIVDDSQDVESEEEAGVRVRYAVDGVEISGADDVVFEGWEFERVETEEAISE